MRKQNVHSRTQANVYARTLGIGVSLSPLCVCRILFNHKDVYVTSSSPQTTIASQVMYKISFKISENAMQYALSNNM